MNWILVNNRNAHRFRTINDLYTYKLHLNDNIKSQGFDYNANFLYI